MSDFFFALTLFLALYSTVLEMFDFQKLEVYQKSKIFHRDINDLIQSSKIHKATADQLFRASLSIPLNIAEGSGRFSKPDRKNFFIIARSSVFETVSILDILRDSNVLTDIQFQNLSTKAAELSKILFAMIKNLEK